MKVDLLIIGAGPFALSLGAQVRHLGIRHVMVGMPMEFWKTNMPDGMFLRSGSDWHLDPLDVDTIARFLEMRGITPAVGEPLSRQDYLEYARWFQEQKRLAPLPRSVERLDHHGGDLHPFRAMLDDGEEIRATHVAVAIGFKHFKRVPRELIERLPPGRFSHTCDLVRFDDLKGKRCLILGGRQSALEWAALLHEGGAAAVDVCHRHDTPAFQTSDWSWVSPLMDRTVEEPDWFRTLPQEEKEALIRRFWVEGRLKLEPWLRARVLVDGVRLWPRTNLVACTELPSGALKVELDQGETLTVDHVILATGYEVSIDRVPFLARGDVLPVLATRNGFPVLDTSMQSSVPGLFLTSMAAVQDFGPFFGFTVAARTSAKIIGRALAR